MLVQPGDVFDYLPLEHHCREGHAVAEERFGKVVLLDTFWGISGSDRHLLTDAELATAELKFNLGDYMQVTMSTRHLNESTWSKHAREDRQLITSQHGLQRHYYLRHSAKPSWAQQIENAREELAAAEHNAESAARGVDYARSNLAYIIAKSEEK